MGCINTIAREKKKTSAYKYTYTCVNKSQND